jgi:hypothetical protein
MVESGEVLGKEEQVVGVLAQVAVPEVEEVSVLTVVFPRSTSIRMPVSPRDSEESGRTARLS